MLKLKKTLHLPLFIIFYQLNSGFVVFSAIKLEYWDCILIFFSSVSAGCRQKEQKECYFNVCVCFFSSLSLGGYRWLHASLLFATIKKPKPHPYFYLTICRSELLMPP